MEYTSIVEAPYPPTIAAGWYEIYSRWLRLAAEADARPVEVPSELPVVGTFEPAFYPSSPDEYVKLDPDEASATSVIRPTFADLDFPKVKLTTELRCGKGRWSQVYRAQVTMPSGQTHDAAVKLVDEAFFDTPQQFSRDYIRPFSDGELRTARELVSREVAVYHACKELWGKEVPEFYGSFFFRVPCGHVVLGIVVEYVAGLSLPDALRAVKQASAGYTLMQEGLFSQQKRCLAIIRDASTAVYRLSTLGIRHCDVAGRNFIVTQQASPLTGRPRVVIFDFGWSYIDGTDERQMRSDSKDVFLGTADDAPVEGCWRAYLRDARETPANQEWLRWWRKIDDVSKSDREEKEDWLHKMSHMQGSDAEWDEVYKALHLLPRWAEDLDWGTLSSSDSESDETCYQWSTQVS